MSGQRTHPFRLPLRSFITGGSASSTASTSFIPLQSSPEASPVHLSVFVSGLLGPQPDRGRRLRTPKFDDGVARANGNLKGVWRTARRYSSSIKPACCNLANCKEKWTLHAYFEDCKNESPYVAWLIPCFILMRYSDFGLSSATQIRTYAASFTSPPKSTKSRMSSKPECTSSPRRSMGGLLHESVMQVTRSNQSPPYKSSYSCPISNSKPCATRPM